MKKKIVKCLLSLTGLATVLISWGAPTQAAVLGDDYPSSWKYGGFGVDPWTMYWRQCTSFAAYRLSNTNGFTLPVGYGNAITWGPIARANGHQSCCWKYRLVFRWCQRSWLHGACCLGRRGEWRSGNY